jgi:anti-sigma factor RsiW
MVTEEKIWEYLDGNLNEAGRAEVTYAITHDPIVMSLYKEILAMQGILQSQSAEQPSMAFTENVMRSINAYQYKAVPVVSIMPLLLSALPFFIVLGLACASLLSSGAGLSAIYHLSPHFMSILTMLFILADSVLLMLFLEDWFFASRRLFN